MGRTTARRKKNIHKFTLVFSSPDGTLSDADANALYEVGCDDALVGSCEGEVLMHFDREAPSFRVALTSAIANVERSGVDVELIRVEPDRPEPPKPRGRASASSKPASKPAKAGRTSRGQ